MFRDKRKEPTPEELNRLLKYNPITGELTWKRRPGNALFNDKYAGKPAGTIDEQRMRVKIYDKMHYASRLIWVMHYGKIKKGHIVDHKNGNTLDNRISNLRTCTHSQNSVNRQALGQLGLKGVTRIRGKYMARAYKKGRCHYLGIFDSMHEAGLAYDIKAKELHGEFANLNYK